MIQVVLYGAGGELDRLTVDAPEEIGAAIIKADWTLDVGDTIKIVSDEEYDDVGDIPRRLRRERVR